ncbi:MAG TPA: hypothetical protein VFL81_02630, partial [Candidatus Saccharimonadales bacterium]|nr:hypothetical protein [Candidatus Saccharimonadales bacterium]
NTEKYFHKWWSLFFDMLALYPALMAIYGGATLAANILLMNSQRSDGTFNNILPFAALLIQVLPLLAVPFIIKATSGSLGKIANMVESKSRKPAEFAAGKAKAYGKFGAVSGGKAVGRGFTKLGTKAGFIDPNNPGVVSRSASRVRKGYRSMRAFDKAVDTSLEARKRGREEEIGERAAEIGVSTGMAGKALSSVGGSRYNEIVAAQTEKAFQERVKSIRADLETHLPPSDKYSSRLAAAISSGNREETTALIGYMATAGGAGGRAALEETLSTTAAKSDEMRVAINNSIYRDNYGSLLGSRGSLAKGGLDASGKWQPNLAPVKIEALASQDEGSLQAHFQQIDQKNAQSILDNESLASKISSKKARILFKARARGDALIPDPSDPAKNPPTIRTSSGTEAILRDGNLYDPSTGTEIDESAFF